MDKKEELAQKIVDIVIKHVEATGDGKFDVNFYQAIEAPCTALGLLIDSHGNLMGNSKWTGVWGLDFCPADF